MGKHGTDRPAGEGSREDEHGGAKDGKVVEWLEKVSDQH
jgi:hypothetical protein